MSVPDPHRPYHIFISRVSGEFGKLSEELAADLRSKGMAGKIQIDFRQEEDTATTLDKLEKYVRESDAVIALIGQRSGSYPTEDAAKRWQHMLPPGIEKATYTQWEVHFARHYGKRLSFYFGYDHSQKRTLCKPEKPASAGDDPAGQESYVQWLTKTLGLDRDYFKNADQLCRAVLKEDWPQFLRFRPQNLPLPSIGALFVGRQEFLDKVRADLQGAAAAGRPWPNHLLWGIGGIGKTRVAMEYAWAHRSDYTALLCVSGETPDKLIENIAGLTSVLGIEVDAATPTEYRFHAAQEWLQANSGWLLTIDNVDSAEVVAVVQKQLATLSEGHVLITARIGPAGWRKGSVKDFEVKILSPEASVKYLLAATPDRQTAASSATDDADAAALAQDVDHLCLALETAAAFIQQRHLSFAAYREALADQPATVLDFLDTDTTEYPRSVARTWLVTFDQLSDPARELLRILCWLAPEPIPRSILEYDPVEKAGCDPGPALDRLRELERYAFVHWDDGKNAFSIHRLLAEITRQQQPASPPPAALVAALEWIDDLFTGDPMDVRSWPAIEPLAPHAEAVARLAADRALPDPSARLLNQVAVLYYVKAQHRGAEALMRRALAIDKQSFGSDHPNIAIRLNNLAQLLQATNRLADAEPLMRRALVIDEQSFGSDHPRVAARLNNLALLLQATNRLADAEPLIRRALAIDELSFGADHPNVARDLNNLAQLLQATNRLVEAEPLMRRALAIDELSFGSDHPEVATDLNNLALLLLATNRLANAEPLMRRALVIDEQSFGSNHPRIATQLNNLAQLLQATNRLVDAEPLMRRALAIDEQSFGSNHPNVARDLNNLAQLLQATNRLADAEPLMRRALAIDELSFGSDHPEVATDLSNLALLLQDTNRLEDAEPLMRRMVMIFLRFSRMTGHQHPHLDVALSNYFGLLTARGNSREEAHAVIQGLIQSESLQTE